MLCETCLGCMRLENEDFKGVEECPYYANREEEKPRG